MREVPGTEGIVPVHVSFSLTDLSQIEKRLGFFSSNPDNYLKEFKYLTQSYYLRYLHDIYIILSSTLLPEEKEGVWPAFQAHAYEIQRTDYTKPIEGMAVPRHDPNWDYKAGRLGQTPCNHMVACLIVSLQKARHKAINFDKLWEISQRLDENLAQFLTRLMEALQKYTKLDPISAEGTIVLFIS